MEILIFSFVVIVYALTNTLLAILVYKDAQYGNMHARNWAIYVWFLSVLGSAAYMILRSSVERIQCPRCGRRTLESFESFCPLCQVDFSTTKSLADSIMPYESSIKEPLVYLIIISGEQYGDIYRIREFTQIGRDASNDVVITDRSVDPKHGAIRLENGEFMLYDFASTAGTIVDGRRISKVKLDDGKIITFGNTVVVFKRI